jgi:hypothetical protein
MARVEITTPEAGHTGRLGGITFADGRAVVDADAFPAEVAYCEARGYTVVAVEADDLAPADVDGDGVVDELPKRSASTEAWRAFAVEHGMTAEDAEAMTRDQLVEHYTKEIEA